MRRLRRGKRRANWGLCSRGWGWLFRKQRSNWRYVEFEHWGMFLFGLGALESVIGRFSS